VRVRLQIGVIVALVALSPGCGDQEVGAGGSNQRYEGSLMVLESGEHGPELCSLVRSSDPPQCDGPPVTGWDWDAVDDEQAAQGTTWGVWHLTGTYEAGRFALTEPPRAAEPHKADVDTDFSPACPEPDTIDPSEGVDEWEAMSQDFGSFEIPALVDAWVSDPDGQWDGPFVGNVIVLPGTRRAAMERIRAHYAGPVCIVERDGPTSAQLEAVQNQMVDADAKAALGEIQAAHADGRRGAVVATVWVADQRALDYAKQRWGELVELRGILRPVH
jgi:hypothetical protein